MSGSTITHDPTCPRPSSVPVLTWSGRRTTHCPSCGREAAPINTTSTRERRDAMDAAITAPPHGSRTKQRHPRTPKSNRRPRPEEVQT